MGEECIEVAKTFWGESAAFWAQTAILFAATVLALVAIYSSRVIERKKAAAEAIFEGRRDEQLIASIRLIAKLHEGEKKIAAFAKKDQAPTEEAKSIRYALNHYEYISVGISQGIYDEEIFKRGSYSTIVGLYDRTKPFIDAVREVYEAPTNYQELECLVIHWKNNPLKHKPVVSVQKRRVWEVWK